MVDHRAAEVIVTNDDMIIVFATQEAAELAGATSPDQLIGRHAQDFLALGEKAIEPDWGRTDPHIRRGRRIDGTEGLFEIIAEPALWEGRPARRAFAWARSTVIAPALDFTPPVTGVGLEDLEDYHCVLVDEDMRVIDLNDAASVQLGLGSADEARGRDLMDFAVEEDRRDDETSRRRIAAMFGQEGLSSPQVRAAKRANGAEVCVVFQTAPGPRIGDKRTCYIYSWTLINNRGEPLERSSAMGQIIAQSIALRHDHTRVETQVATISQEWNASLQNLAERVTKLEAAVVHGLDQITAAMSVRQTEVESVTAELVQLEVLSHGMAERCTELLVRNAEGVEDPTKTMRELLAVVASGLMGFAGRIAPATEPDASEPADGSGPL